MTEHGKRADCSHDPLVVKAAKRLVRRAGHKVNGKMLGSNQDCMTTHGGMADCSQVPGDTRAKHTAVLGGGLQWFAGGGLQWLAEGEELGPFEIRCSQPELPDLKCPTGFMPVGESQLNIDKVENGVRLLARAVTCKCTKMPPDADAILKKARKCSLTTYKKENFKDQVRTFVTSNPNGAIFTNNAELGEAEKVGSGRLLLGRGSPHKNWGGNILSAKLKGACANVEYVGASSTVAYAGVLSVVVSDDDGACNFNKAGCFSRCVRWLGEAFVVCR